MATYTATVVNDLYRYVNGAFGGPQAGIGDTVQLSANTSYILTSGELNPQPGIKLIGGTLAGTIPNSLIFCSGTSHFQVRGSGTSTWYNNQIHISGIYFDINRATSTGSLGAFGPIAIQSCNIKFEDCLVTGPNISNSNGVVFIAASGYPCYAEMHHCLVQNVGSDGISTNGVSALNGSSASRDPSHQHSYVKLYNCQVKNAGQKYNGAVPASNDQLITMHGGFPVYAYGCHLINGIPMSGPAPGFMYFCKVDPTLIPAGASGQSNSKGIRGAHVVYGNYIRKTGGTRFEHYAGDGTNLSWVAPQVQLRQYGLFKANYLEDVENNGSNEQIVSQNNGNMIIDSNIFNDTTATAQVAAKGFLGISQGVDGTIRNTGVHNIISNNLIFTDGTVIKCVNSIPVGTGVRTDVYNNTILKCTQVMSRNDGGAMIIPAANDQFITYFANNYVASGAMLFGNTAASDVWGVIRSSGNIVAHAIPTAFPGSGGISTRDQFSKTASSITGTGYAYSPSTASNLTYTSGVTFVDGLGLIKSTDGTNEAVMGTNWIGAKAPQVYSGEVFPSIVMS